MTSSRPALSREVRQTAAYYLTIASGQLVGLLLLPIITRYLTPAAYGEYALGLAVYGLVGVLASSWVRNVAFRLYYEPDEGSDQRGFYFGAALLQALTSVLVYALVGIALLAFHPRLLSVPVLLSAMFLGLTGDAYLLTISLLRAEQQTRWYVVTEISTAVLRLFGTAFALVIGFRTPETLFLCAAGALTISGLLAAFRLLRRLPRTMAPRFTVPRDLLRFGLRSMPQSVSTWVMTSCDRLVLDHFTDKAGVGIYSVGYAAADRVIAGLTTALFMMAWPQILEAWADGGKIGTAAAIRTALRLYLWLTVGPLAFLVLYRHEALRVLAGASFSGGSSVLPLIAVASWVMGFAGYLSRPIEIAKRYGTLSLAAAVAAVTNVAANIALVPRLGARGAGAAAIISSAVFLLAVCARTDFSFLRLPAGTAAACLAVCAVAWLAGSLVTNDRLVQAGVFAILYAAAALWALIRWRASATVPGRGEAG
jgi:O-antigen/teichoic acid export membrane protein